MSSGDARSERPRQLTARGAPTPRVRSRSARSGRRDRNRRPRPIRHAPSQHRPNHAATQLRSSRRSGGSMRTSPRASDTRSWVVVTKSTSRGLTSNSSDGESGAPAQEPVGFRLVESPRELVQRLLPQNRLSAHGLFEQLCHMPVAVAIDRCEIGRVGWEPAYELTSGRRVGQTGEDLARVGLIGSNDEESLVIRDPELRFEHTSLSAGRRCRLCRCRLTTPGSSAPRRRSSREAATFGGN